MPFLKERGTHSFGTSVRRANDPQQTTGVAPTLPTSVKALTGAIVVIAVIVIGLVAWKITRWRQKKKRAASLAANGGQVVEKPAGLWSAVSSPSVVSHAGTDIEKARAQDPSYQNVGWVPQVPPVAYHGQNSSSTTMSTLVSDKGRKPGNLVVNSSSRPTPPPSYKIDTTPDPSTAASSQFPPTPPVPTNTPSQPRIQMPTTNHNFLSAPQSMFSPLTPSPRTASFNIPQFDLDAKVIENSPQLMTVVTTFAPQSEDELLIAVGEQVLLIQEYEDTWCLVQRAKGGQSERGVVPRFCLQECRKIAPVKSQI